MHILCSIKSDNKEYTCTVQYYISYESIILLQLFTVLCISNLNHLIEVQEKFIFNHLQLKDVYLCLSEGVHVLVMS